MNKFRHSDIRRINVLFTLLGCYKQAEEKEDDEKFTAKGKTKSGIATAQKQECNCPSLQPSLRNYTHAFFTALGLQGYRRGQGDNLNRSQ